MKRIKIAASVLALLALTALNFRHASNGYGILQQDAWASGSTDDSGGSNDKNGPSGPSKPGNPDDSGSSDNSNDNGSAGDNSKCCSWWGNLWGDCNTKTEPIPIKMECEIVTTFYLDASGRLVGTCVIKNGEVTASYSGGFASTRTTTKKYTMDDVTKVNCPTGGSCNNCSEYTPQCN